MIPCSPIAVALYDYDTEDRLGEDGNLSFYEGEIIEVCVHNDVWDVFSSKDM